jgi:hypothetical protein
MDLRQKLEIVAELEELRSKIKKRRELARKLAQLEGKQIPQKQRERQRTLEQELKTLKGKLVGELKRKLEQELESKPEEERRKELEEKLQALKEGQILEKLWEWRRKIKEELWPFHFQIKLGPRPRKGTVAPVKSQENSQRMRSFLHLALGTVVAQELGLPELYIVDNGIMSINLPLVPCRAGSRSTRSTDPLFLGLYQELVSHLYSGQRLAIVNPFLFKTKKDIVKILEELDSCDVIKDTVSCWAYPLGLRSLKRNGEKLSHCGYCLPCLVRRIAVLSCDLEKFDAGYSKDVIRQFGEFRTTNQRDYVKTVHLRDLLYFCSRIKNLPRAAFLREYPELALVGSGPLPDDAKGNSVQMAIDIYKKFAEEVLEVIQEDERAGALRTWMG